MPTLDIPLIAQDQSPTSQTAPNGLLKLVYNGRYVDYGQTAAIRKRLGIHSHTVTGIPAGIPIDAIAEYNGVRVAYSGGDAYAYDETGDSWSSIGDSGNVSVTERRPVLSTATTVTIALDSAQAGARTAYLHYTPPNAVFYYELRDTVTGNTIIEPTIVNAGGLYNGFARCAASSTHIFIAYEDRTNNDLRALVIDVSDDSVTSDTAIITDLNGGVSGCFDITHDDGGDFDIVYHNSGGNIVVKRFTSAKANTLTSGGAAPFGTPTGLGIAVSSNGDGMMVYRNSTGSTYQAWHIDQTTLALTNIGDFGNASANTVVRAGVSKTSDADELIIVWTHDTGSAFNTHMRTIDVSTNTVLAVVRNLYDLQLSSKPMWDEDRSKVYAVVGHQGFGLQTQRDAYLVNLRADEVRTGSGSIVPYVEARFAHGLYHDDDSKEFTGYITEPSDGVYEYFHGTFTSAQTEELPGLVDLKATRFTSVQTNRHVSVDVGSLNYVAGGELKVFDGFELTEAGFAYFPWATNGDVTSASSGGNVGVGTYGFRFTYEWKTQDGSVWRSAASPVDEVVIGSGTTNEFSFTLPQLRLTRRLDTTNPITIAMYRTLADAAGAHHRMVALGVAPPINDPHTSGKLNHTDGNADSAFEDRDLLYQDGGVLFNEAPPPSDIVWAHDDALFGVDPEDPKRVWGTKQTTYGIPAEANSFIQIRVDSSTGITAGASSDGSLILFDETSVYVVGGQGFTATGNGGYQPPRKLPASNGCISHLSVVQGGITGDVYFQSSAGICVLSRGGQSVQIISAPIEDTLTAFPVVQGSVLHARDSLIYWTLSNAAETSGCIVWYDYRRGKWGVDVELNSVPKRLAIWGDEVAMTLAANQSLRRYASAGDSDDYRDPGSVEYPLTIATHEIKFGGLDGMALLRKIAIIGEMTVDASNGGEGVTDADFDIEVGINGQKGITSTLGQGSGVPGDGGDATTYSASFEVLAGGANREVQQADLGATIRREFSPLVSRVSSLEIWLSTTDVVNTSGIAFVGLSLDFTPLRGLGWTVGGSGLERA